MSTVGSSFVFFSFCWKSKTIFKMETIWFCSVKPLVKQLGCSGFRLLKQWWFGLLGIWFWLHSSNPLLPCHLPCRTPCPAPQTPTHSRRAGQGLHASHAAHGAGGRLDSHSLLENLQICARRETTESDAEGVGSAGRDMLRDLRDKGGRHAFLSSTYIVYSLHYIYIHKFRNCCGAAEACLFIDQHAKIEVLYKL